MRYKGPGNLNDELIANPFSALLELIKLIPIEVYLKSNCSLSSLPFSSENIGKYWKIINEMTNEVWRISNLCFFQFYMKRALIGFATEDTEASYIRCISTKSDPLLRSI